MTLKSDASILLRFTSNKVYVVQFHGPKSLGILLIILLDNEMKAKYLFGKNNLGTINRQTMFC